MWGDYWGGVCGTLRVVGLGRVQTKRHRGNAKGGQVGPNSLGNHNSPNVQRSRTSQTGPQATSKEDQVHAKGRGANRSRRSQRQGGACVLFAPVWHQGVKKWKIFLSLVRNHLNLQCGSFWGKKFEFDVYGITEGATCIFLGCPASKSDTLSTTYYAQFPALLPTMKSAAKKYWKWPNQTMSCGISPNRLHFINLNTC